MSDDTDAQIPENTLLASAYLDDEATSDERALVETSPEALAEVAALSQLRVVLTATAPMPSLSERESHLAGALDVWERMSDRERTGEATPSNGVDAAAAAALSTPTSSSDGRRSGRRRSGRSGSLGASQWILGAAATLVVLVGGVAVVRGILDAEADSNEAAVEQSVADSSELGELEADEAAEVRGDDVGDDFVPTGSDVSGDVATDPDADGLFPESGAMEETPSPAGDAAEEAGSDGSASDEQPAPPPEIDRADLESLDDLADYGSLAVRPLAGEGPVITSDVDYEPFDSCEADFGIQERLEPARYQGEDVLVGVDLENGIVFAYTEDCDLVESTALPSAPSQP